jgi:hypothetical protein
MVNPNVCSQIFDESRKVRYICFVSTLPIRSLIFYFLRHRRELEKEIARIELAENVSTARFVMEIDVVMVSSIGNFLSN